MRAFFILSALLAAVPAQAEDLRLGLPIACELGKTCWVQQYVDHDPSTAVQDHACGAQTYDGHDGTDIRIRDTASKAAVVAAAAGTVKAVRDGVEDHLMRTEADRARVGNRECGNGVLVSHPNGWETQYCHLRQGSITVKPGDRVEEGQQLGQVGYSGMAAFPHVHLTVRKDGKAVDPFRPDGIQSCDAPEGGLWTDVAGKALAYQRSALLRTGFAAGPVDLPELESGSGQTIVGDAPETVWPALVAYVWAINLEAGDEIVVSLDGPGNLDASNSATLDRAKAQYLLFAGKKQPKGGWPKGRYEARVEIRQGGAVRLSHEWQADIY
jgi:hypothetical protein